MSLETMDQPRDTKDLSGRPAISGLRVLSKRPPSPLVKALTASRFAQVSLHVALITSPITIGVAIKYFFFTDLYKLKLSQIQNATTNLFLLAFVDSVCKLYPYIFTLIRAKALMHKIPAMVSVAEGFVWIGLIIMGFVPFNMSVNSNFDKLGVDEASKSEVIKGLNAMMVMGAPVPIGLPPAFITALKNDDVIEKVSGEYTFKRNAALKFLFFTQTSKVYQGINIAISFTNWVLLLLIPVLKFHRFVPV